MSQTYASQRALINVSSGIMIVKRNWPFLFVAHHMYSHVNTLLGFDVARTFDRCIETVGKQIYRYAHNLVKSQRVKSCLQEMESAKVHTKSAAAEYEAAPLLLLAIFNEDKGLLYGVTECLEHDVQGTLVTMDTPGPALCGRDTIKVFSNCGMAMMKPNVVPNLNTRKEDRTSQQLQTLLREI
ncbi:hypothetical protein MTO96_044030 [Rhipicephalus appendiculatus]